MTQALGPLAPLAPLLYALILISLGIGLPIIVVLTIRFLWSGHLSLGRSRELDKLVWQLHRIASSLEQQTGLSLPAGQPATERSSAPAIAQQAAPTPAVQTAADQAPPIQAPPAQASVAQAPANPSPAARTSSGRKAPGSDEPPRAGVNSMFGF
jgi:hypothetical protein